MSPSPADVPPDRASPNWRRWIVVVGIMVPTAAVLALLAYGFTREPKYIPTPLLARPATPFTLTLFDGTVLGSRICAARRSFSTSGLRGVRPAGPRRGRSRRPG